MKKSVQQKVILGVAAAAVLLTVLVVFLRPRLAAEAPSAPSAEIVRSPQGSTVRAEPRPRSAVIDVENAPQPPMAVVGDEPSMVAPPAEVVEMREPDPLLEAVLSGDLPTTNVLGQEYAILADGELQLLTPDQLAAVRGRDVPVDGAGVDGGEVAGRGGEIGPPDGDEEQEELGDRRLFGYVLRGDRPIANAELFLTSADGARRRSSNTDADGRYQFTRLLPDEYRLLLQKPDAPNKVRSVSITPDGDRREDFIIPDYPPLMGRVSDPDGNGIEAARLEVRQGTGLRGHVQTDGDGDFQLFPLEPAIYLLAVTATGFLPKEIAFEVTENRNPAPMTIVLERTRTIEGYVVGPGGPIQGAWVGLFSTGAFQDPLTSFGTANTDAAGRFRFSVPGEISMPSGTFRAGAYREGHVPAYSQPVNPGGDLRNIAITLQSGAVVTGRVVSDDQDRTPLEGVEVAATAGFAQSAAIFQRFNVRYPRVLTRPDGTFRLPALEAGQLTLAFAAEGFVPLDRAITVQEGENPIGDVALESVDGSKPGRLFGILIDERGSPLAGHNIYVRNAAGQGFSTTSDSRGGFRLEELPEGVYTLFTNGSMLRGDLYSTMDQTVINVRPGGEQIVVLYDFNQAARVRVLDAAGEPIRNFRVRAAVRRVGGGSGPGGFPEQHGNDYERTFQTPNGEALIDALLWGTASFTISVDGVGVEEIQGRSLGVGQTIDLGDVRIGSGGALAGVVRDERGAPVAGVLVRASRSPGPSGSPFNLTTTTDAAGAWRITGLPGGEIDFEFTRNGYVRAERPRVTTEQATPLEVTLQTAAIVIGRVSDSQGRPLNNIHVRIGSVLIFTNAEGRFYADTIAPGSVVLDFRDPTNRYESKQSPHVELQPGNNREFDVQLDLR